MNIRKIRKPNIPEVIAIFFVISLFWDAFCFGYIGNYPITLFTFTMILAISYGICCGSIKLTRDNIFALMLMAYLMINYVITGMKNINSLTFSLFYFITFIFIQKGSSEKPLRLFSTLSNIMAIYAIYQLFGRVSGLPLSDIIWENHMVSGFNWTNSVYIGSVKLYRSNAILREPSGLSQMLAINILYLTEKMVNSKKIEGKKIIFIIINIIGMICSFSGTGIMVLLISFSIYVVKYIGKNRRLRKIIVNSFPAVIVLIVLLVNSPIGQHYIARSIEITQYNENNASGYVRFLGSFNVMLFAWEQNILFGSGIGTYKTIVSILDSSMRGITVNGFTRPAAELGIIGLILWITFLISFYKKEKSVSFLLALMIFPYLFCLEGFLSNAFWVFLYILKSIDLNKLSSFDKKGK